MNLIAYSKLRSKRSIKCVKLKMCAEDQDNNKGNKLEEDFKFLEELKNRP